MILKKLSILCAILSIFLVYSQGNTQLLKREFNNQDMNRNRGENVSPIRIISLDDALQIINKYVADHPEYKIVKIGDIQFKGRFNSYAVILEKDNFQYLTIISSRGVMSPLFQLMDIEQVRKIKENESPNSVSPSISEPVPSKVSPSLGDKPVEKYEYDNTGDLLSE